MQKQYYAILMRDPDFNNDTVSDEELQYLTTEEINNTSTVINSKSTNYKEIYELFQQLKKGYPKMKALYEAKTGNTPNGMEICLVRISVMQNWETLR